MGCFDPSILLDRVWSLRDSIWKGFKTILLLQGVHMVAHFITPFIWQSFFCLFFARSCTVKNLSVFRDDICFPFRSAREKKNNFFAKVTVKHLRGKGNFTEWVFFLIWLRFGLPIRINVWYPPWAFTTIKIYNGWPNTFYRPFRCGSNCTGEKRSKVLAPFLKHSSCNVCLQLLKHNSSTFLGTAVKTKHNEEQKNMGNLHVDPPFFLEKGRSLGC